MPYTTKLALYVRPHTPLKTADIFTHQWRIYNIVRWFSGFTIFLFPPLGLVWVLPMVLFHTSWGLRSFVALNRHMPYFSWALYLHLTFQHTFEQDFYHAYQLEIESGCRQPFHLNIFLGKDSMSVPIRYDSNNTTIGNDVETLKGLRMWYNWMRYKRVLFELVLPKRLTRVDNVNLVSTTTGPSLGSYINTIDLGRSGSTNVAFFLQPTDLAPPGQRVITKELFAISSAKPPQGLEFVRAWNRRTLSWMSLVPVAMSLIFAAVWMGVWIGKYKADPQVVVQTAFTVSSFIVIASTLLTGLIAFLDEQVK